MSLVNRADRKKIRSTCCFSRWCFCSIALKLDYREGPHTVICCNRDRPALLRTGLAIAEVTGLPLVERWQAGSPDDDGAFPDDGDASMISFRLGGTDASGSTSGGFRNPDGKWDAGMFPDRDGGADFDSGQDGGGDSDGGDMDGGGD